MLAFRLLTHPVFQCVGLAAAFLSGGISAAKPIDYEEQVRPILQQNCYQCHGQETQESGLRLDQRNVMLRGGDLGQRTLVPGKPDQSFLIKVLSAGSASRMPPEGKPLSDAKIQILQQWIEEGAMWPGQMHLTATDVVSDHWSLQKIDTNVSPATPSNSIDALIDAKLKDSGLERSIRADPITQLRRLHLIMTGLPPTPEDLHRFQNDPAGVEAAYVKAVDQLLNSPRYGERWAQHWLDVIRWAETVGFETNFERVNAWPYRDWVINSLNEDKPYNQFVYEQLAGDTLGQDAALGFLVAGPANLPGQVGRDEEAMRHARQDELDEVIRTVSQGLLGLTIGCARCHNHKFDPILQRDYYAMQAVFAGLSYGDRRNRGPEDDEWSAQLPAAQEKLNQLLQERRNLQQALELETAIESVHTEKFAAVTAHAVRMTITATQNGNPPSLYEFEVWTPTGQNQSTTNVALASTGAVPSASSFALANQTRHFDNLVDGTTDRRQAFPWVAATTGPAWIEVEFARPVLIDRVVFDRGSSVPVAYELEVRPSKTAPWEKLSDALHRMPREDDIRQAETINLTQASPTQVQQIVRNSAAIRTTRGTVNRLGSGPQVFAARFTTDPEPTWHLRRGDPMQRTEQVAPAIPRVLGDLDLDMNHPEPERRIALAEHLTQDDHPLTARVIVNRVWHHHFGHGLIDTPSDLGVMGSKPTHPKLLDWLTSTFVKDGWSLKRLHRRIVLSETFRQNNRPKETANAIDAEARLLWRFPPRRMEAEAIRDTILQTSGKLNLATGGRGFSLFKQRGGLSGYDSLEVFDKSGWRRMIYAHKIRMQSVDIFGAFDCPDAGQMRPKRTQSITPAQALSLFNSPFVNRQSQFFADRITKESGVTAGSQIQKAFEIALSRLPTPNEQQEMETLVAKQGLTQLCRVLMNTSEFVYIP